MKVRYHRMETTVHIIDLEVDNIEDMEAIEKDANLMSHLHGWDKIVPAEQRVWVTEVKEDEEILAKNPLYY